MSDVEERNHRSKGRRDWKYWLPRIIIAILVLPLFLLAIGFIYETIASRSDPGRFPPPGELIDIGGYRLHLNCTGDRKVDQPTIVLESGDQSSSPDWTLVQPEIAKFARVCSYDRAGLGWSDPGPEPRSSKHYATELHTLLEDAGEEPPFILVAHSYGGHTVRLFAHEHFEEVGGMVLVDSRHPSITIPTGQMSAGQYRLWEFMARCGFFRLAGKQAMGSMAPAIVENFPDYPYPIVFAPKFFQTGRLQEKTIKDSDKIVAKTGPYGELPLVIIAHEIPDMFSFLPSEEIDAAEALMQEGQSDLTNLSTNSQFLTAEGSGHNIPVENPGVIIAAVQKMIQGNP